MKPLKKRKVPPVQSRPDKAYEAEKLLRHFCSVTSEEMSQLLGAVIGELDYGASSANLVERGQAISVAQKAAEKALHLAQNLRYFAVQTRLDVHLRELSQVVLDIVDRLESDLKKRKITLAVSVEDNVYCCIDGAAIEHVLLNLLWNAAFLMPEGGELSLSLSQEGKQVEICVADTGGGIPPEHLDQIFEPYLMPHQQSETEGRGLGLAVAKTILEAHGGSITVKSKMGSGTQFVLRLPHDSRTNKPNPFLEKRRFRRVPILLNGELYLAPNISIKGKITILSTGGCFFSAPDSLGKLPERGTVVSVKIAHCEAQWIPIDFARVASVVRNTAQGGVGLEFLEVPAKAKRILAALVKSHSSEK